MVWVWKSGFWETRSPGEVSCLPDGSDITGCPLCASSLKPEWPCPSVSASDLGQPQPTNPPCGTWGVCLHLASSSCCRTSSTCFLWSLPVSSARSYHLRGLGTAACLCPLRKDNASSCRNGQVCKRAIPRIMASSGGVRILEASRTPVTLLAQL